MVRKPIVIAYDISRNKVRRKILKILKAWRLGGQKSVHECRLTLWEAEELFVELSEPLDPKTDILMMAWLEPHRSILFRGLGNDHMTSKNLWHVG